MGINIKKIRDCQENIPIVLGGGTSGLGVIRAFGEVGIPTIYVDNRKTSTKYSKYTHSIMCPDPILNEAEFINALLDISVNLKAKGILFACEDRWIVPINKHRELLESKYIFSMSKYDIILKCLDKTKLYEVADEIGIPTPKTIRLKHVRDIRKIDLGFPYIIKVSNPLEITGIIGYGRSVIVKNTQDVVWVIEKFEELKMQNTRVVVQEIITGGPENLYTLTSYSNSEGDIIAYSIGHKIRQSPPDAGTILSGIIKDNPKVYELGSKLIKHLRFHGIANTEFKFDKWSGEFKLMEINPRPGSWNYSALRSGVNLPYINYREALGEKVTERQKSKDGKIWIYMLPDIMASLFFYKRQGYDEHSLSLRQWYNSVKGQKIFAVWKKDDPLPYIFDTLTYLTGIFRRVVRKIVKKVY